MEIAVAAEPLGQSSGETDHLAAGVLRALGRSFRNQFSLAPSQAFWLGLITFGLLPLFRLGRQFRDYVAFEKQQLWHLAEWLRVRRGGEEALALQTQLRQFRPRRFAGFLIVACVAFVIAVVCKELGDRFTVNRLIDSTWRLHRPWHSAGAIWKTWVVGLGIAYMLHALRVARHHLAMEKFVDRFNAVLRREGLVDITMTDMEAGVVAGWWWTAGILSWFGALWSIPMALAGAAQRRYINGTSTRVRAEMLERVRAMLQQRRPAVAVPNYVIHSRRCGNGLCQATLRASARFCPRCGASTQIMSEVA